MSTDATTPDTIVLIHGFWVTPRSWEDWKARDESRGYRVLTPAYPGFAVEVEAINADPTAHRGPLSETRATRAAVAQAISALRDALWRIRP